MTRHTSHLSAMLNIDAAKNTFMLTEESLGDIDEEEFTGHEFEPLGTSTMLEPLDAIDLAPLCLEDVSELFVDSHTQTAISVDSSPARRIAKCGRMDNDTHVNDVNGGGGLNARNHLAAVKAKADVSPAQSERSRNHRER